MPSLSRKNLLLQQLDIPRNELRHPERLQGDYLSKLQTTTKLLIIGLKTVDLHSTILQDILLTLNIRPEHCQILPLWNLNAMILPSSCLVWQIGAVHIPTPLACPIITSPTILELASNVSEKRAFWQKISHYVDYFQNTTL